MSYSQEWHVAYDHLQEDDSVATESRESGVWHPPRATAKLKLHPKPKPVPTDCRFTGKPLEYHAPLQYAQMRRLAPHPNWYNYDLINVSNAMLNDEVSPSIKPHNRLKYPDWYYY